jgi:hypothetical protein
MEGKEKMFSLNFFTNKPAWLNKKILSQPQKIMKIDRNDIASWLIFG